MQALRREKPPIEGTWNSNDVTWPEVLVILFPHPLLELWKGVEDCVEVIGREVVKEHTELWWRASELAARVVDDAYAFRDCQQSVWPGRAAEISDCDGGRKCLGTEI